jgi:hypothetical protein
MTVTLDAESEARVKKLAEEKGISLDAAANELIRRPGYEDLDDDEPVVVPGFESGPPVLEGEKYNKYAADLFDYDVLRKMALLERDEARKRKANS